MYKLKYEDKIYFIFCSLLSHVDVGILRELTINVFLNILGIFNKNNNNKNYNKIIIRKCNKRK